LGIVPQQAQALALEHADLIEHRLDVAALLLQRPAPLLEHAEETAQLRCRIVAPVVHVDQFLDLRKRQPQTFAAQRELEAGPVGATVDTHPPFAARCSSP